MTLSKVNCTRCGGSGNFSFNLVRGTVCFKCNGAGTILVDLAKEKTRLEKKAIKDAANNELIEARIAAANKASAEREAKYKDDPRIGPKTKARCREFEAVAHQTYKTLEMVDLGKYVHAINDIAQ